MIQNVVSGFSFLAFVCSCLAAYFCYQVSQVNAPTHLVGSALLGGMVQVNTKPLEEFVNKTGRRNKAAALWSAAAASFAFLAWGLGVYASWSPIVR